MATSIRKKLLVALVPVLLPLAAVGAEVVEVLVVIAVQAALQLLVVVSSQNPVVPGEV
jgi:hypothetical protein